MKSLNRTLVKVFVDAEISYGEMIPKDGKPYVCTEGHIHDVLPCIHIVLISEQGERTEAMVPSISSLGAALLNGELTQICLNTLDKGM